MRDWVGIGWGLGGLRILYYVYYTAIGCVLPIYIIIGCVLPMHIMIGCAACV